MISVFLASANSILLVDCEDETDEATVVIVTLYSSINWTL